MSTGEDATTDLLPCPFCGAEAEIERYGTPRQSTIYACTMCGCRLETGETFNHGVAWNKRADIDRLREEVSLAMSETAPSWGWRFHRLLALLDLNFGSADETNWSMLRDAHRRIRWDPEALQAANEDKDWPPLGWKEDKC